MTMMNPWRRGQREQRVWLAGPTICGLWGMFEDNFGLSSTPTPYARVTPSRVGDALLPFHCPGCGGVIDFSDAARREAFHDTRSGHDNYWCPRCGARFEINDAAAAASGAVTIGADGAATSIVEQVDRGRDGLLNVRRRFQASLTPTGLAYLRGTDILCCPAATEENT